MTPSLVLATVLASILPTHAQSPASTGGQTPTGAQPSFSYGTVDATHPAATGGTSANYLGLTPGAVDCPTSTQNSTSVLCLRAATGATVRQNYAANINLDSYAGATPDPVALYAGVRVHRGGRQSWALNTVTHLEPGAGGGIGYEVDVNNWSCDAGTNGQAAASGCIMAQPIGLLITGSSPYPSAAAIDISGASTATPQWHDGIEMLGGSIIGRYSIYTNNSSVVDYKISGVHSMGIDLYDGSYSRAAIRMKPGQPLLWNGVADHAITSTDTQLRITSSLATGASLVLDDNAGHPVATLAGTLTTQGLVVAQHTPATSREACTPGQTADDATYHYWCASVDHWLRVAGAAF